MDINFRNVCGTISVSDDIFNVAFNEPLVHQVITSYLATARIGTKAQKTRSQVSGGGVKPWKQKGSGRARAGTIRSPLWRGGGKAFAATPRFFTKKVNRKMYRNALCGILSELFRQERLYVVENFDFFSCKTKAFLSYIDAFNLGRSVLVVTDSLNRYMFLASRNVPDINVIDVEGLNPISLFRHEKVILDEKAIKKINGWLL